MKTVWTVPLLALVAACSSSGGNNASAPNNRALAEPPVNSSTAQGPAVGQEPQPNLPAGLDCVRLRLSTEQRAAVGQAVMDRGASRGDRRVEPLLQAVESCGDELSWSPQKRHLAAQFALAAAGVSGVRRWFGSRGIHIEELDNTIVSDREVMAAAQAGRLTEAVGQSFALRHNDEIERLVGGRPGQMELGGMIGSYVGFHTMAELFAFRFERER